MPQITKWLLNPCPLLAVHIIVPLLEITQIPIFPLNKWDYHMQCPLVGPNIGPNIPLFLLIKPLCWGSPRAPEEVQVKEAILVLSPYVGTAEKVGVI